MNRTRATATAAIDAVRLGRRTVITTPRVGLRFGNFLYVWLQAHLRSARGQETVALFASAMAPWLNAFPELRTLTVSAEAVRFRDRRMWDGAFLYQRFGIDFSATDVRAFVLETIAPHLTPDVSGRLVINIRRGDYYTDFRSKYAFDQVGYLKAALDHFSDLDQILVVSDDAEWCREHLDEVVRRAAPNVEYSVPDPLANFISVASASRIIGTNSTFTYWGAYVAGVVHGEPQIVMPRFHGRMGEGRTDAHQLDPRWIAIDGFH